MIAEHNGDYLPEELPLAFLKDGFDTFTKQSNGKWWARHVSEDDQGMDLNDDGDLDDIVHVILHKNTTFHKIVMPYPPMLQDLMEAFEADGYLDHQGTTYLELDGFEIDIDGDTWKYVGGLVGWKMK